MLTGGSLVSGAGWADKPENDPIWQLKCTSWPSTSGKGLVDDGLGIGAVHDAHLEVRARREE